MPKFGNELVTLGMEDIKDPTATYLTPHQASTNIHHDYSAV